MATEGNQPNHPSLYANSFQVGLSTADIFIVLQRNGQNFATLNLSYTVAKSLKDALAQIVDRLEKSSGRSIMTSEEVSKYLSDEKSG